MNVPSGELKNKQSPPIFQLEKTQQAQDDSKDLNQFIILL
jgi:hypothetical protein